MSVNEPKEEQLRITKQTIEISAGLVPWMIQHRLGLAFSLYQDGYTYFLGARKAMAAR